MGAFMIMMQMRGILLQQLCLSLGSSQLPEQCRCCASQGVRPVNAAHK